MQKRKASLDASFWINACRSGIASFLPAYFDLFVCSIVAGEILRPSSITGELAPAGKLLQNWLDEGKVTIQDPSRVIEWFDPGENAAISLALERNYVLLIDDRHPYNLAKAQGLKVIATPEFIVFLYARANLDYQSARRALGNLHVNKRLLRQVLIFLTTLAREKGDL